ncbi:MAG: hypothetical protein J6W89_06535 [Paludibacteraceae bacterium]|nr:hypothetical protein [Paludibacteraceae bacterium]
MPNIFCTFVAVKAVTTYEAITQQKLANQWSATLAMFPKAFTLDVYYHIYQAVEEYEPERTYGYRKRICANMQICSDLWGGVSKEKRNAFRGYVKGCDKSDGIDSIRLGYAGVVQVYRLGDGWRAGADIRRRRLAEIRTGLRAL